MAYIIDDDVLNKLVELNKRYGTHYGEPAKGQTVYTSNSPNTSNGLYMTDPQTGEPLFSYNGVYQKYIGPSAVSSLGDVSIAELDIPTVMDAVNNFHDWIKKNPPKPVEVNIPSTPAEKPSVNSKVAGGAEAVAQMISPAIQGGYEANKTVSTALPIAGTAIGSILGPAGATLGHAVGTVASAVYNRGWGEKSDTAYINTVNNKIGGLNNAATSISQASSTEDFVNRYKNADLALVPYKQAYQSGFMRPEKGEKKSQAFYSKQNAAFNRFNWATGKGAEKIAQIQGNNAYLQENSNLSAFGGPLAMMANDGMGAIEYGFASDLLKNMNDRTDTKNKISGINPINTFKKGGKIHIKKKNRGKFTKQAKNAGMGTQEYASHVLANKEDYPASTVKRANFARNASNWSAFGGYLGGNDNLFAIGGDIQTHGADFSTGLSHIDAGDTHEENPNEGVQMGVDPQGIPNLVEEGEVVYNDYVYSQRIELDKEAKEKFHFSKKQDITYADAAKRLEKEIKERPNDPISRAGFKIQMQELADQQERQKEEMAAREAQKAFEAMSPDEQVELMTQAAAQEQGPSPEEIATLQQQAMAQQGMPPQEQGMPFGMEGGGAPMGIEQLAQQQAMGQESIPPQQPMMAYGGRFKHKFDNGGDFNTWLQNLIDEVISYQKDVNYDALYDYFLPNSRYLGDDRAIINALAQAYAKDNTPFNNFSYGRDILGYPSNAAREDDEGVVVMGTYNRPKSSYPEYDWDTFIDAVSKYKRGSFDLRPYGNVRNYEDRQEYKDFTNEVLNFIRSGKSWDKLDELTPREQNIVNYLTTLNSSAGSSRGMGFYRVLDDGKMTFTDDAASIFEKMRTDGRFGRVHLNPTILAAAAAANSGSSSAGTGTGSSGITNSPSVMKGILSALNTPTWDDFLEWAKKNDVGESTWRDQTADSFDWGALAGRDDFRRAMAESNSSLGHAIGQGYDFGSKPYVPNTEFTLPLEYGTWTDWKSWFDDKNTDAAIEELRKRDDYADLVKRAKDGTLKREDLDKLLSETEAYKKGTQMLRDSEDLRLAYFNNILKDPKAPKPAKDFAKRFVTEDGKWREKDSKGKPIDRSYDATIGIERSRKAGSYWHTPIEWNRKDTVKNFLYDEKSKQWKEVLTDVDKNWNLDNTYKWNTDAGGNVYNYYKVKAAKEAAKEKIEEEEEGKDYDPKLKPEWPRYLGLFGPAAALAMQVAGVGKPSTAGIDAAVEASSNNNAALASYQPIGNYVKYNPLDVWQEQNRLNANTRATARAITNNAGPLGTQISGLLANEYNNQVNSGDANRKAWEYNDLLAKQVAEHNSNIDKFNAEAFNRTSMANAEALNRQRQANLQARLSAEAQKMNAKAAWDSAIYANVGNLFKGISDWGKENAQHNMIAQMAADGIFGTATDKTNVFSDYLQEAAKAASSAAEGGKLKKRRRRGGLTY